MTPVDTVFEDLHRTYFDDVRRFIERRVRDRQLAEDLAQETFLRAYRARASLDPDRPPWPWLQAIARNLIINTLRDGGRRPQIAAAASDAQHHLSDPHPETHPDAWFADAERRHAIDQSLAQLSPRERRVLLLRCRYELSYEQIASAEDLTMDALKSLLKRARVRFRLTYAKLNEELEALMLFPLLRRHTSRVLSLVPSPLAVASVAVELAIVAVIIVSTLGSPADRPTTFTPETRSRPPLAITVDDAHAATVDQIRKLPDRPGDVPPARRDPVRASMDARISDAYDDRTRIEIDRRDERPGRDGEEGSTFYIELPVRADALEKLTGSASSTP